MRYTARTSGVDVSMFLGRYCLDILCIIAVFALRAVCVFLHCFVHKV